MKSIQYVQNGKGVEPREIRSAQGLSLFNAMGDVSDQSMGFQIVTDTMTFIKKQVITQQHYEVDGGITRYVPIAVGDGAFGQNILTNLEFSTAGDFESGLINTGTSNDRLAQADATVAGKTVKIMNWAKGIGYSIFEIEQALQANNWDAIAAKERSRKRNWDLGLQNTAFMGLKSNPTDFPGLLTSPEINVNTQVINQPISTMNASDLNNFVASLIAAYFVNSGKTAKPDRFLIPYSDFFGLQTLTPGTIGTYPVPKLTYLLEAFKAASENPNFQIIPLAYCDYDTNTAWGVDRQLYLLYKYDQETVRMDIPVDFTVTQANTANNFQFQSAAYAQFTGVHFYRSLQALMFSFYNGS